MISNEHSTLFNLKFDCSFDEAIKDLKSIHNRRMLNSSHNYHVLYALWRGDVIDDYNNKPTDAEGRAIHNIKTRISDLVNKYQIKVERRLVDESNHKEYWIDRGVSDE